MKQGTEKKRTDPASLPQAKAKGGDAIKRVLPAFLLFFLLWLAWGAWETFAVPRLPAGLGMTLLDSVVMKSLFWGVLPLLMLLRYRKDASVPLKELFCSRFPVFSCVVLLCLTTAFLYTVRLARGLVNTHVIFDPMFIVLSLTAGVVEEFGFRGVIFNLQEPVLGFWPAALLNGVMFTLYHYPGLLFGDSWLRLFSFRGLLIFVMGVVFCFVMKKRRNLPLNMTVHTVWDILSYLFCLAG